MILIIHAHSVGSSGDRILLSSNLKLTTKAELLLLLLRPLWCVKLQRESVDAAARSHRGGAPCRGRGSAVLGP